MTPVFINQQNGTQIHTQAISLDLLKANGTPTLVTDSNGNHYLIALTSQATDGQNGGPSLAKTNGRITLQVEKNTFLTEKNVYEKKYLSVSGYFHFSEITVKSK